MPSPATAWPKPARDNIIFRITLLLWMPHILFIRPFGPAIHIQLFNLTIGLKIPPGEPQRKMPPFHRSRKRAARDRVARKNGRVSLDNAPEDELLISVSGAQEADLEYLFDSSPHGHTYITTRSTLRDPRKYDRVMRPRRASRRSDRVPHPRLAEHFRNGTDTAANRPYHSNMTHDQSRLLRGSIARFWIRDLLLLV
jgi:hypothetical protein